MKKLLILDRDGTLILEPEDEQIDSLEKLEYYPKVFQYLAKIVQEMDYELLMITNQDGLGTDSFPEDTFWPAHHKMLNAFAKEGINFKEVLIDRSFPADNSPTRKPEIGLLIPYLNENYDITNSYVVGDRVSDVQLAKNIGAKGIFINEDKSLITTANLENTCALCTTSWRDIYQLLRETPRQTTVSRQTKETDIQVSLSLDGTGQANNHTGLGFFDHMLDQLARHSGCDLTVQVKGDLHIDEHHTIEDTAIVLGQAFYEALGNKRGLERYGFCLPMDDCLAQVAIDFGGRNWLVWEATFKREKIGEMPTEMFIHFFKSFSDAAKCNLNIKAEGENEHHKIEAIFKAFAKSIKMAIRRDVSSNQLPTTKGLL